MFYNSIDAKPLVTDPNGNEIVNLPVSFINRNAKLENYRMKQVPSHYTMRPDLIALVELGDTRGTEYIMKFNQFGNPFSIDEDDVLLIPDLATSDAIMNAQYSRGSAAFQESDSIVQDIMVQNYYKFAGKEYVDMESYNDFLNSKIPSGNSNGDDEGGNKKKVPYLLDDNETAIVIRNGKIYFNNENDEGLKNDDIVSDDIDKTIMNVLNNVSTSLSGENCMYNGTSLSDFIKALNNSEK